jgi:hypothetical protein
MVDGKHAPYHIWIHSYTVMLVQVGVDFWKIYVGPSPSDVVRSWLRLHTLVDCIPHPNMYTKYFSTLITCVWAYEGTLTLLRLCRWGWISGKFMMGRAQAMLLGHG